MRHLAGDLTVALFACLCFWAVKFPDDSMALLDWTKDQARIIVELVKEPA